ncbi:MAG: RluA family pseudouridine synthase [Polyangiaceae bacterium]|nr:RluA family pseudouridine synthase [Polyangiaceae bacterium]
MKRWVVRLEDGARLADVVACAGEDHSAISEGRVFIGSKRATTLDAKVRPGDEVRIGTRQDPTVQAAHVPILFAEDGILACNKPAGIPTVPDHAGAAHSLVALVAEQAKLRASDLRITSRLDRDVSGVVLFATEDRTEARLRKARAEGRYARRYVAIAALRGDAAQNVALCKGFWTSAIGRGRDALHRAVAGPDAKPAETRWEIVAFAGGETRFALLAVAPITGRTHQIRVHASHARMPLVGDRDYGGTGRITLDDGRVIALSRIALHAARVTVSFGEGNVLVADAPIPAELARLWTLLGGAADAWDMAVSCDLDPAASA